MIKMPLLGMGTWGMGGKYEKDTSNVKESIAALRYGIEQGITLIDVAEIYGAGLAEEIVGSAIVGYPREDIFLVSKVWKTNLGYPDVIRACEQSLERLHTDYLDLYLVHWPNEQIPLHETIGALEHLVEKGLIKAIGVSNFTTDLMEEARASLTHYLLTANQIEYNILAQQARDNIIPYCMKQGIQVMAYRPLAKGTLPRRTSAIILQLSQKYNKTPAQIALNWIISQGIAAIPKASTIQHIEENVGALGWTMAPEDIGQLSRV